MLINSITKGIKKLRKILSVILTFIAVVLLFLNLLINFPAVQTALTHSLADYYSKKLHVKIRIGKVEFEFLKKLVLKDVYIEDQHADTLLCASTIKLDIGQLSFKNHQLFLSNVILDKATIHLTTYKKDSALNFQFLIDAFASKDTTKNVAPGWKIALGKITLNNIDFRLLNQHDTTPDTYGVIFSNLRVHDLNARINTIKFLGDTIRATIENLSAKEQSGFNLQRFSCFVNLSPRRMELDELKIITPNTEISTDLVFRYNKFSDFDDFINKVDMKADFHKSKVCFQDIGYFAHSLKAVHNCLTISGEYRGTVNHLSAHKMNIGWGKYSMLEGEAVLNNITEIDSAIIKVNITNMVTSKTEIEDLPIPPFDQENHIDLPENISKLKTIHFTGFFDGTIKTFKASGAIETEIGNVSANLHMWEKRGSKEPEYSGKIETKDFDLGAFWQIPQIGAVTTSVTINGTGLKKENADASLSGVIESITVLKYKYQNSAVTGELKKGYFSGLVKIIDPHLLMDFNGKINLESKNSVFQFETHIDKANLTALHFIKDTNTVAFLSSHIKVNATGNSLDNLEGSVYIDSTMYAIHTSVYHLKTLSLTSAVKGDYHDINLKSDYADGELSGHFHLANTIECLQNLLSNYIPNVFPKEKNAKGVKEDAHDYALTLRFNEDTGLTNLFVPGLRIAQGTLIKGRYNEASNNFNLSGSSEEIDISAKKLKNWNISASGDQSSMVFNSGCDTLFLSDSLYAASFALNGNIRKDTIHYTIAWNNDSGNFANIPGFVGFPSKSKIAFRFLHPVISMVDSVWKINDENLIVYDSSRWSILSFIISHNRQSSISLKGVVSNYHDDKLGIELHNLNLASFKLGSTPLAGELNGTASISDLFDHPYFISAINFTGLTFNKEYIGDGNVNCSWDTSSQAIVVDAHVTHHGTPVLTATGKYTPGNNTNSLSIDAGLTAFPTKLFQPYLKVVSSVLDGSVTGQAHISGEPSKPIITGNVNVVLKQMKFDYLNTSYHSPSINVDIVPDTFKINSSQLIDEKGNSATLSGTFTHTNFKDLQMDLNIDATNFLCLNTGEGNNSAYFGTAYATGNLEVYGPLDALTVYANVTTEKNTTFNISLDNSSDVDQGNYIQFKNKGKNKNKSSAYKVTLGGIQMDFTIHVTPDAKARILFSSKGEVLESQGYGTIKFGMDNIGVINMRGTYTVESGYYNFVLQNIINKKFLLQSGGNITWNGDPYNADINLTTVYATSASLEPFYPSDISGIYNKRVQVNCNLDLSGKLASPLIKFGIDLPTVDNDTKSYVESTLSNQDELTTQVFGLLLINSFMPVGSGIGSTIGNNVAGASSAQILSNQLTNMFNNINKNFNIALDYQPGTALNPTEVKLAFSKQFFNNKVEVKTDVGAISSTNQTNPGSNVVGEVTVEYKITKNGKLRAKAFNKANDNTALYTNSPYTQGAGFSYKEGFNVWRELWHKMFGKKTPDAKAPIGTNK